MAVALTRCWSLAFRAKQHDALGQSECGWPKHWLLDFGKGEGLVVVQHSVGIVVILELWQSLELLFGQVLRNNLIATHRHVL